VVIFLRFFNRAEDSRCQSVRDRVYVPGSPAEEIKGLIFNYDALSFPSESRAFFLNIQG